ncbi:MAG: DUF1016 N-terminal domain-containing protein [Bacteroidales bacterium]|nr:DUF1016 N-terminal domain-containing protein [Bacteroidales bacterium]
MEKNFESLIYQIEQTNQTLQNNARLVINRHITAKAWLTGYYIIEYEQFGSDRAKYGDNLLPNLSNRLGKNKFSATTLKIYRQFYLVYPQLKASVVQFVLKTLSIGQSATDQLLLPENQTIEKSQSVTDHKFREFLYL